jgi:hypothetical protein
MVASGIAEPSGANQFLDLVGPPGFQRVIDGDQEELLRGKVVVGLITDELLDSGRDVSDP